MCDAALCELHIEVDCWLRLRKLRNPAKGSSCLLPFQEIEEPSFARDICAMLRQQCLDLLQSPSINAAFADLRFRIPNPEAGLAKIDSARGACTHWIAVLAKALLASAALG